MARVADHLRDRTVKEAELQSAVIELAQLLGWLVYHTHDSRSSQRGFPDLVLVKAPRVVFAELKDDRNQPSVEQRVWLDELGKIDEQIEEIWSGCGYMDPYEGFQSHEHTGKPRPGVEAHLWRPSDWRAGDVELVLRGQ